jgi:hypothetical protein
MIGVVRTMRVSRRDVAGVKTEPSRNGRSRLALELLDGSVVTMPDTLSGYRKGTRSFERSLVQALGVAGSAADT